MGGGARGKWVETLNTELERKGRGAEKDGTQILS